jgi:GNAT superfamily N-acetyltransferase
MATTVRPAHDADFRWIVDLIDRHRGEDLTAQQRSRQGFVQGHWDVPTLRRLAAGPGIVLAEVDGKPAGVAISSAPGAVATGPASRVNELAAQRFRPAAYFLYGPVVVDDPFRGQGVLRALDARLFAGAAGHYQVGVAFIEDSNAASLAVHDRLGWQAFATFDVGGCRFHALSKQVTAGGHR